MAGYGSRSTLLLDGPRSSWSRWPRSDTAPSLLTGLASDDWFDRSLFTRTNLRCAVLPFALASVFSVVARVAPQKPALADPTLVAWNGNEIPLMDLHGLRGKLGGLISVRTQLLSGLGDATSKTVDPTPQD